MTVHDQISAALQRAADLAPDGRRIQAELAGRTRRYKQRRALLIGATAAAGVGAVAATVPAILRGLNSSLPSNYPTTPVPPSGPLEARMLLRPGWLPATMLESNRMASLGGSKPAQLRIWRVPNWTDTSLTVSLEVEPADLFPLRITGHQTVNGHQIAISDEHSGATTAQITLAQGMVARVAVSGTPHDSQNAARIADSLRADGQAICEVNLRFGWLPRVLPADQMTVSVYLKPDTEILHQILTLGATKAPADSPTASAEIAGSKDLVFVSQDGTPQPVTVRGRPGTITYEVDTGKAFGQVIVELADGRWLGVGASGPTSQITRPVLLRMAEELVIGPDPTIDWDR